jgi:putative membrane protein
MLAWLKALHLISMVAWFAGLFYMFRLFVYHAENADKSETTRLLTLMARRLYYRITVPAFLATLVCGIAMLVANPAYLSMGWMHAKLTFVVLLIGYHHYVGYVHKRFARGEVFLSSKQCRMWNEVPTLLLIAIVLLAVLRPF